MKRSRPAPLAAAAALLAILAMLMLARTHHAEPVAEPEPARRITAPPTPLLDGRPLDLNQASAADLELLPSIGPTLARRIVAEREAHGPFRDLGDLHRVRGIGPRTLDGLRGLVETR